MEDDQIVSLYCLRKEEAVRETHRKYGQKLYHIAMGILRCSGDAEESVNDTYLSTWKTIPPQKPNHFYGYIAKICRNLSLDRLDWRNAAKRGGEVVSLTQEMELCIPDKRREIQMKDQELGRVLNDFFATLTPENRMVFLRRYWYGDSVGEIATRYGITENAVSTRLYRTREKLAAYLKKEEITI